MNDASERYAHLIEATQLAVGRGDRPAAVQALRAAIETTRNNPMLHREHVAALVRLGTLEQELGRPAEAEQLLVEAIAVGERHLGAEHPSLGVALNELSRLHIRQSDYARAEPVLRRLLRITRAKGDRHPDVATVLAGLALAKRGLGDDAGAEGMYRRALRIREEALAPNHMAIVITLEQLSETCAARGNFGEALVHLQRALMRRERALGAEHATVHALHTRMADLQRQNAEAMARAAFTPAVATAAIEAAPALPTPEIEVTRAPIAQARVAEEAPEPSSPPAPSSPPPRERIDRRMTPVRARSVAPVAPLPSRPSKLVFIYEPEPAAPRPAPAAQSTALTRLPASAISPVPVADAAVTITSSPDVAARLVSRRRTTRYASVGAAVVVLVSAGFGFRVGAANSGEHPSTEIGAAPSRAVVTPASTASPRETIGISAGVAALRAGSAPAAPASGELAAPSPTADKPAPASDTPSTTPTTPAALPSLRKLVVPKVAMPSLDSLIRGSDRFARDADSESIGASGRLRASASSDNATVIAPVLIGSAPTPRFPDELRAQRIEGEVIVQFRVNEKGRVVPSSMQVVQSQHELFTEAVRSVLPKFRFEPARSGAPESKPQSAWVQFRTRFDARK